MNLLSVDALHSHVYIENHSQLRQVINAMDNPTSIDREANASTGSGGNTAAATTPPVSSTSLLGLQGSLHIDHRGAIYTLRATSKGGLILTK